MSNQPTTKPIKKRPVIHGDESSMGLRRTLLLVLLFSALTHAGLAFQEQIKQLVQNIAFPYSSLLTDQQVIYSIWLGLLGVHAAVGAVAPILGYTLLTTTITSASRVAPSGAVIAAEIRWRAYLQTSLALLAGSIVGIMSAPSALGLALAGASTVYVVVRTMLVFRAGFELIERPEKFDAGARKYLATAVQGLTDSPLDAQLSSTLKDLNEELSATRSTSRSRARYPVLVLGDSLQATQLLQVKKGALSLLLSEARKLNLELHFSRESCPEFLPRGEAQFFRVSAMAREVKPGADQTPSAPAEDVIDFGKVAQLQGMISRLISYGTGPGIDRLVRAPMLVQRHVATVIYEAIPNQRPHDLEYGLDVLGSVIDSAGKAAANAGGMSQLNAYQWVLEVPSFVIGQIERETGERLAYARKLASFLRARLMRWLEDPELDWLSRVYIAQIVRLFSIALGGGIKAGESFVPVVREITFLDKLGRREVVVYLERELILLLVRQVARDELGVLKRRVIIKTMVDVLSYSRTSHFSELHGETYMSALAVCLFTIGLDEFDGELIVELIEIFESKIRKELPIQVILGMVATKDEISERWRWSTWEMEQKESGEAHFLEMENLLARAALFMLRGRGWELRNVEDADIPSEHVIDQMINQIDARAWYADLPAQCAEGFENLKQELSSLLARRSRIIAARVERAHLDERKVKDYVDSELAAAAAELAEYSRWISESCLVQGVDKVEERLQFGMSSLIPRQCFVSDEILDISIMMGNSGLGQAVQDFEIRSLVQALSANAENGSFKAGVGGVWDHVAEMISRDAPYVWIIGIGVSQYDIWQNLDAARSKAIGKLVKIRFDNVGRIGDEPAGVWVVDPKDRIEFFRYEVDKPADPVYEMELSVELGRLYCCIAQISDAMRVEWLRDEAGESHDRLLRSYKESVLLRTAWSFEIDVKGSQVAQFFSIEDLAGSWE